MSLSHLFCHPFCFRGVFIDLHGIILINTETKKNPHFQESLKMRGLKLYCRQWDLNLHEYLRKCLFYGVLKTPCHLFCHPFLTCQIEKRKDHRYNLFQSETPRSHGYFYEESYPLTVPVPGSFFRAQRSI